MGTWGEGVFENDDAADWVEELLESTREEQLANIETAFAEVLNSADYVEAPDASIAITAATLLAATRNPSLLEDNEEKDQLAEFVQTSPPFERLIPVAVRALRRILADDSELVELWVSAGRADVPAMQIEPILTALLGDGSERQEG